MIVANRSAALTTAAPLICVNYQDISRLHGDRMPDVRIGQIGIECRRNQAQVWASALLDNDAVAIDPHKTISSKWPQGFKLMLKRFLDPVVLVQEFSDVAIKMAHEFFDDAAANAVSN